MDSRLTRRIRSLSYGMEASLLTDLAQDDYQVLNQSEFDRKYGVRAEPGHLKERLDRLRAKLRPHECNWWLSFVPLVDQLRRYNVKTDFLPDLMAGVTIGVMSIPQGLAYGMLAGVSPVKGLYTSFYTPIFYALFGSSRHVSFGTFAVISLMVAAVVNRELALNAQILGNVTLPMECEAGGPSPFFPCLSAAFNASAIPPTRDYVLANKISVSLTFLVGLVQIVLGILNLGFISVYLSDQLVQGLTTGAGLHVLTSQVGHIFGIRGLPRTSEVFGFLKFYVCLCARIRETNWVSVVGAVSCFLALVIIKELVDPRTKPRIKIPIPIELLIVIACTGISYATKLEKERNVYVIGDVPSGLETPILPDPSYWPRIIGDAITIGIIVFSIDVSMAKLFAKRHGYRIYPNQEWFALGFSHTLSSFFSCHCAGSSLSRSAVVESQGVKTQLYSIIAAIIVLLVLYLLAPYFHYLPRFCLAAIIVVALKGILLQFKDLKSLYQMSKVDFWIWIVTFVAVIVLNVTYGLIVGVAFALASVIARAQRPDSVTLGQIGQTGLYKAVNVYDRVVEIPGIKIYRFDSPLFFANSERFTEELISQTGVDVSLVAPKFRKAKAAKAKAEKKKNSGDGVNTVPRVPSLHIKEDALRERLIYLNTEKPPTYGATTTTNPALDTEEMTLEMITAGVESTPSTPQLRTVKVKVPPLRCIVLDCSSFSYLDMMGQDALAQTYKDHLEVGIQVYFAAAKVHVRRSLERGRFYARVPISAFFVTVHDAVLQAQELLNSPIEDEADSTSP